MTGDGDARDQAGAEAVERGGPVVVNAILGIWRGVAGAYAVGFHCVAYASTLSPDPLLPITAESENLRGDHAIPGYQVRGIRYSSATSTCDAIDRKAMTLAAAAPR